MEECVRGSADTKSHYVVSPKEHNTDLKSQTKGQTAEALVSFGKSLPEFCFEGVLMKLQAHLPEMRNKGKRSEWFATAA
jgi:hypothetical protein